MKYLFLDTTLKSNSLLKITDKAQINYIINVLRFQKNQQVVVLDGFGKYCQATITMAHKKEVALQLETIQESSYNPKRLNLYFAIPNKLPKLELILKMGTELGVNNFYPIITEYTQVHSLGKLERLNQIIKSAASQSESRFLPILHTTSTLKQIDPKKHYLACVVGNNQKLITQIDSLEEINILIGPEGGFSQQDLEFMQTLKHTKVSLGKKILRLETACLLALGISSLNNPIQEIN